MHHRLIDMGFDQRQSVKILALQARLLSMSAVVLLMSGASRSIILILSVLMLVWVGIMVSKTGRSSSPAIEQIKDSGVIV